MSDAIDIAGWEVREVCIGLTVDLAIGPREHPGRRARDEVWNLWAPGGGWISELREP